MPERRIVTCAVCLDTFEPGWTEEDALAEMRFNYGDVPPERRGTVCDDCWREHFCASCATPRHLHHLKFHPFVEYGPRGG